MKRQEGYKCDFCSKMSSSKSAMMRHEAACRHNPENISMCKDCKWLEKFERQCYDSDGYPSKYTEFICKATNKKLYHNKVLRFYKELRNDAVGNMQIINIVDETNRDIMRNANFDLALDNMVVRLCF